MYGVVLWNDRSTGRALIWCEDHGNLAFFNAADDEAAECSSFDEGDLVKFRVDEKRDIRRAFCVEVVACEQYPYLAQQLRDAKRSQSTGGEDILPVAGGKILPFQPSVKPALEPREPQLDIPSKTASL